MFGFKCFVLGNIFLALLMSPLGAGCPPHCECSKQAGEVYYRCRGKSDFVLLAKINMEAKIICVPRGSPLDCATFPHVNISHNVPLPSLHIDSCALPPSLACIAGRLGARAASRVGARAVGTLRVENCTELTAGHVSEFEGLNELWVEYSRFQKTLPFDVFARIPSLTTIRILHTRFNFIPPSVQNTQLNHLELWDVGIKDLPPGAFRSFPNLARLLLLENEIKDIKEGVFEGLPKLSNLDLSSNPLRQLGPGSFLGAPHLKQIRLHSTGLEMVRAGAFEGLEMLEKIDMNLGRRQLKFEEFSLSNLTNLKVIYIESSPLSTLPKGFLRGSKRIEQFTITSCGMEDLSEEIFADQINLQKLILKDNKVKMLPEQVLWPLESLEELDLSKNLIETLPESVFDGLTSLKIIRINDNLLTTIPPSTFNGPLNLIKLSLRNNLLTLEQDSHQTDSPFADLIKLEEIDLSGNLITRIFSDWRLTWVHSIRTIDLSRNRISRLRAKDVEFLGFHVTVDLQNNNITTVAIRSDLHSLPVYRKATFILDKNPLNCDCELHSFLNYTKRHKTPKFRMENAYCAAPESLVNQTLQNVRLDSLTCKVEDCPENCKCNQYPESSTIEFECLQVPHSGFLNPRSLNLTKSKLRVETFEASLDLPEHILFLDISNTNLTEVPTIPNTVIELDLRFNKVTTIPEEILRDNLTLYLAGNKVICTCWNRNQIRMLNKYKHNIKDYDSLICNDDSYLTNIDTEHICDVWTATIVSCSLAALSVIAAVIVGIAYYNMRKIVKCLYKRGWPLPPWVYEDEIDNKQFDILISYSDAYEKFAVSRLVPLLRRDGYTVCLRCAEWDIGDFLPKKVPELVEKSRRTVVLLSNDYFDSEARLELKAALMSERRGNRKRVLLVVTKDLDPDPTLDKFLLKRKKNLDLNDAEFWERLKRNLPRKRKEKVKPNQRTSNVLMATEHMLFKSKMSLNQL